MNYEQHNETFHFEMEKLTKESSWYNELLKPVGEDDEQVTRIPIKHLYDMWDTTDELMKELDQLESRGTSIPSLTLACLRIRAQIFVIPEQMNLEEERRKSEESL